MLKQNLKAIEFLLLLLLTRSYANNYRGELSFQIFGQKPSPPYSVLLMWHDQMEFIDSWREF